MPAGDLLAAWRASKAGSVIAASSAIPSGPAVRVVFPVLSVLLRWAALRRFAIARVARIPIRASERSTEFSRGHARAEWDDGTSREAWLRLSDAQHFTETVTAEIAPPGRATRNPRRLHTPAALFGPPLATDLGAEFF